MQERHRDRLRYFNEQGITTKKYVIPYINDVSKVSKESRILEIGCGEGGNLAPFIEMGCEVMGVDLNVGQIEKAREYTKDAFPNANAKFLSQNIYDVTDKDIGRFDIIMLRDVIEHIPHQDQFLKHLHSFLSPTGKVFFGFPPWRMPFGGHQQICKGKLLSKLPYYHLLPMPLYKTILKLGAEPEHIIKELVEIKETGIGLSRFNKIVLNNGYQFEKNTHYLINPNYEIKFGLTPRVQLGLIKAIPFFRDFITTCCYCVIGKKSA